VTYVYLPESVRRPASRYVGRTRDLKRRLADHNAGRSPHTAKDRPWKPVVIIRFDNDRRAEQFEQYMKSGSGHAFAMRHFWG